MSAVAWARLVSSAEADPEVAGLVLTGGRGKGVWTPRSDWDALQRKGRLPADVAVAVARASHAVGATLNLLYRAAKSARDGDDAATRLEAVLSAACRRAGVTDELDGWADHLADVRPHQPAGRAATHLCVPPTAL